MDDNQKEVLENMRQNESERLAAYYDKAHAKIATVRLFVGKNNPGIGDERLLQVVKEFLTD